MKRAIIIVYQEEPYNSMFEAIFGDLNSNPDVYFLIEKDYPQGGLTRYLSSRKLKKLTFGLSNRLFLKYFKLPKLIKELRKEYDNVCVLMHNSLNRILYPIEFFELLKNKATFNLLYLDVHDHRVCRHANYLFDNKAFDRVFTIDQSDARKYNIMMCNTPYSRVINKVEEKENRQLYFCGAEAGRMYVLYKVWREVVKRGINAEFDLACSEGFKDFFEGDSRVHFINHLSYTEVLKKTLSSSCILDITQKDQHALTLRAYEAVTYNKRLLTNNKSILDFKYYNSRFMQYFEKIEDIDWDWLNKNEKIDYGYEGDFSPLLLLEKLL